MKIAESTAFSNNFIHVFHLSMVILTNLLL